MLLAMTAFLFNSAAVYAAGAIAVDDEEGTSASEVGYGIGQGATRDAAAADAVKQCKSSGNSNCKVAVKYDTCGAYAASKGYSGIGWGSSEAVAKKKALEECGSGCKIVVADCDK
ncbi:DUF4189 domain-containing protein [Magnetospirillum sulfuroxidans]|nr:DUF4189 domain-containing protein [Magnetospirillum sulfuroxidans]